MPSSPSPTEAITAARIEAARPEVERVARRTPVLSTRTISERAGGTVALKAENLQRTGSFKVRGASAKLAALGAEGCANGVVAASAGNHAQGLAAAAAARGVRCEVFVPGDAPIAKAEAARGQGAIVHIGGASLEDCLAAAQERAREAGMTFVHPFDDPDIVAGQGSLGLELLEDVPDLARVVVPVGGGGLAAGIAIAVKSARPEVEVVGVQAAACAPYPASLEAGRPVPAESALTIADGIAVKRPGDLTLPLLGEWLDGMAVVEDEDAAEAMFVLMERCKLVVEGAGAVGVAALLGGLARLLTCVADAGGNVVDVSHVREGFDLHVRETAVELVLETRGRDHADRVIGAMRDHGYPAQPLE
jgi:threonine dehydratase